MNKQKSKNVLLSLDVGEVEDLVEDLYHSAKKLNKKYKQGAGDDQEALANKIDIQLTKFLEANV